MISRGYIPDARQTESLPEWHVSLLRMLRAYTGNFRILSFETICGLLRQNAPEITETEVRDALEVLKQRGSVGERHGALGGSYWFSTEEARFQLAPPARRPSIPLLTPARDGPCPLPAEGDISQVFKGPSLKELVLLILKSKGYAVPARPGSVYAGITLDAWAETPDGRVIIVECTGVDETLKAATVWDLAARARTVMAQDTERRVEAWLVCMGRITPDIERICVDLAVRLVRPLELIEDAMSEGILGIGWRCMRPYVARIGEPGVFLGPNRSGKPGTQPGREA